VIKVQTSPFDRAVDAYRISQGRCSVRRHVFAHLSGVDLPALTAALQRFATPGAPGG
jgi:hypothetical protein